MTEACVSMTAFSFRHYSYMDNGDVGTKAGWCV